MIKKITLLTLALLSVVIVRSQSIVPVTPTIEPSLGNGEHQRSPILVPVLYIDGYTLTAGDNTLGSTIRLLDANDNVVFSTYVSIEGDIQLPTTLSGSFTIRVIRDDEAFEGELEL